MRMPACASPAPLVSTGSRGKPGTRRSRPPRARRSRPGPSRGRRRRRGGAASRQRRWPRPELGAVLPETETYAWASLRFEVHTVVASVAAFRTWSGCSANPPPGSRTVRTPAGSDDSHSSIGAAVCGRTSVYPSTPTTSPARGGSTPTRNTVIRRSAPSVVTNVRSSRSSRQTQIPLSMSVSRWVHDGHALARQRGPDELPVEACPVSAREDCVHPVACRRDEDVHRGPGGASVGARVHVPPTDGQVRDVEDVVHQRLAGVDHARHGRTVAVPRASPCEVPGHARRPRFRGAFTWYTTRDLNPEPAD